MHALHLAIAFLEKFDFESFDFEIFDFESFALKNFHIEAILFRDNGIIAEMQNFSSRGRDFIGAFEGSQNFDFEIFALKKFHTEQC